MKEPILNDILKASMYKYIDKSPNPSIEGFVLFVEGYIKDLDIQQYQHNQLRKK